MELTQLKQFVAVAETGSLSLAAERLYISQPALSTMLKKLESELGVALFHRTRNKITLNEAGELALQHAQQILVQAERMKTELREFSRRDKIFKVGFCEPSIMWFVVPKFTMMFPDLELQPSCYSEETQALEKLYAGEFDLLVSSTLSNNNKGVITRFLCQDRLLLSVMKNTFEPIPKEVSLRDVMIEEFALFQANGFFGKRMQYLYDELEKRLPVQRFNDYILFQQYLKNTGATTVNTQIVQHYRQDSGERDLIPISDPEATIDYHILYPEQHQEKIKPLLQWLTASFGE